MPAAIDEIVKRRVVQQWLAGEARRMSTKISLTIILNELLTGVLGLKPFDLNPKNGFERVVENRDSIKHLQIFMYGSWRHSSKCRESTNKECRSR